MQNFSSSQSGLLFIFMLFLVGLILAPEITQSLSYHQFADGRTFLDIPNTLNVVSNVGFCWGGWFGLNLIRKHRFIETYSGQAKIHIGIAIGTILVALGSSIYHWNPNNTTLVLDRLPMAFTFGLLLIDILQMYVITEQKIQPIFFWGVAILGSTSVLFWMMTGNLKPYILFQFFPMLALPYILVKNKKARTSGIIGLMIFYGLAKAMELGDDFVMQLSDNTISGHTIKHLLAGCAVWAYFSDREI